jgi:magnesium transporter
MVEGDEGLPRDPQELRETLAPIHPVDLADLLDDVDLEERVRIFEALDPEKAAQVLAAMPHDYKIELVDRIGEERLAPVIDRMPDSAVADIIDRLPAHREKALLDKVEREHADDIQKLRQYDEKSAGGRMTRNFVTVPETFTAGEVIRAIQGSVDSHTVDFIYVVDDPGRLRGVFSLPKLMIHPPQTPVTAFMRKDISFVGPQTDQEEVARIAQKYRLRHVPVVDNDMRLLGVVTLQDIIEVIKHEASEDIMRLAGADHIDTLRATFLARLKSRIPWLSAAMGIELVLAWVMKAYDRALTATTLTYFIPIIMAMGGNVGLQSSTTVVRGLATGTITPGRMLRVVASESRIGLAIGMLAALITGGMAWLMTRSESQAVTLSLIVLTSMFLSMSIACTMGALTPLLLHRMRIDPAVSSGPFITAINDMVNVTLYLTLASLLLSGVAPR